MAAETAPLLVARRYQEEILEAALRSNVIAVLPTGAGRQLNRDAIAVRLPSQQGRLLSQHNSFALQLRLRWLLLNAKQVSIGELTHSTSSNDSQLCSSRRHRLLSCNNQRF